MFTPQEVKNITDAMIKRHRISLTDTVQNAAIGAIIATVANVGRIATIDKPGEKPETSEKPEANKQPEASESPEAPESAPKE